jgi:hypothetical protein
MKRTSTELASLLKEYFPTCPFLQELQDFIVDQRIDETCLDRFISSNNSTKIKLGYYTYLQDLYSRISQTKTAPLTMVDESFFDIPSNKKRFKEKVHNVEFMRDLGMGRYLPDVLERLTNRNVEYLDLSGNLLNDDSLYELQMFTRDHYSLKVLDLSKNSFTEFLGREVGRILNIIHERNGAFMIYNKFDILRDIESVYLQEPIKTLRLIFLSEAEVNSNNSLLFRDFNIEQSVLNAHKVFYEKLKQQTDLIT